MVYLDLTLRDIQCAQQPFVIGRRGTAGVLAVRFDYSAWVQAYGEGVITLLIKPYGQSAAYPVVLVQSGTLAVWEVSISDTQTTGVGQAELLFHPNNSSIDKSAVFGVAVLPDIGRPLSELPDAYEDWVARLEQLGAEAQQDAQSAAQSAAAAAESAASAAASAVNADQRATDAETARDAAQIWANAAGRHVTDAVEARLTAEAWAVGERGGVPVLDPADPTYHNNSKFWAELAAQNATDAGFAFFDVDDESGQMIVTITPNLAESVSFAVNENLGILEVFVNG